MVETKQPKRFVIIDGKSVFYRGYFALPNLSTKDGTPTGGVFGFASMALEVIRKLKPDYVAVAWDKPKTNIRKRLKMYPEYKAGRKPPPPDFYEQIPILHELLQAFGWPLYELDDYEADDIMGALALQAQKKGIETLLVTSDLDALQLIGPLTKIFVLKTGISHIELYSAESFKAKYGLDASQFLDLKAIKGDSSDNIPGVPGIGEKGATELLQKYKTLDGVYDNLVLIKDQLRRKLENGKDLAYLSKKLGAIWTDAPVKLDLNAVDGSKLQPAKVVELLNKLEFRSLAKQLPTVMQTAINDHQTTTGANSLQPGKNVIINSDQRLAALKLPASEQIYIHSRAAGKHGHDPQTLIISTDGQTVYTLNLAKIDKEKFANWWSVTSPLVGYDLKTTLKVLINLDCGKKLPPVGHDVLIGAFLLNSLRREQTLSELAEVDLRYEGSSLEDLSPEEVMQRAPEIIATIKALYTQQLKELALIPKLTTLAKNIEWPVIPVLAQMESTGIKLDTGYLQKMNGEVDDMISDIEQKIYGHAGEEFNIGSPVQLANILFNKLHLGLSTTGIKKGKTGYSTAAAELDKLRELHPIIDLISQWREVIKLKNTYIDTLPKLVDRHSRLHTTFNLTIAQTGRLSSTDPNLQNIPVRTDLGRRIRTAFVVSPGNKFVSADYSQFELRLSAAMSHDQELIDMFNRDVDIHLATAAQVYHRQPEDVTKQMRRTAKAVNFGILYGMSPHGLTIATGMTYEQAEHFIKEYMDFRKPLIAYLEGLKERARKDGYIETLFGRRRPMPDIHSSNFAVRSAAERAAMNMPIQGTEADLMKMAMVNAYEKLRQDFPKANILLQIHDSLIVETPSEDASGVALSLKQTLEAVYPKLPVKLTVDTTIGNSWGEL
jgi:DNA polymerase-1